MGEDRGDVCADAALPFGAGYVDDVEAREVGGCVPDAGELGEGVGKVLGTGFGAEGASESEDVVGGLEGV